MARAEKSLLIEEFTGWDSLLRLLPQGWRNRIIAKRILQHFGEFVPGKYGFELCDETFIISSPKGHVVRAG